MYDAKRAKQDRKTFLWHLQVNGPRVPGGLYRCGYWAEDYEVLAMWSTVDGRQPWLTVRWADGRETTHCTRWDGRRDRTRGFPGVSDHVLFDFWSDLAIPERSALGVAINQERANRMYPATEVCDS